MDVNYDLIVIGSGIGGLTAALTASREGKTVLVLEAAKEFGGYINPFTRKKFHFDPGIHYLGELGKGQRFRKLLDHLGLEDVKFKELNPEGFDWYIFPDYQIRFGANLGNYEKQLVIDFPHEKEGIQKFFKIIDYLDDANTAFMKMKGLKGFYNAFPYLSHFIKRGKASLQEILDAHFKDPKLKAVIAAPCGDIGLPPSQVYGLIHLGIISHYSGGGYFPDRKTDLRDKIVEKLKLQGAVLKSRSAVEKIMDQKGVVAGVQLENGDKFFSRTVISNAQAGDTYKMIDPFRIPAKEKESLQNLEHSIASVCVFLGVKDKIDTSIIQDRNIWFYGSYDIDGLYDKAQKGETTGEDFFFLNVPSMKDPEGGRAPEGHHVVEIVTLVKSQKYEKFFDQKVMQRDKEYRDLKEMIADNMIRAAEKFIPGLRENIVVKEISTPATNYSYVKTPEGNIYGPAQTVAQSGPNRFSMSGPLEGLYLCGASVISAGVFPCCVSGFWAGKKALKRIDSLTSQIVADTEKPLNNSPHKLTFIQKIRYWSSIKPRDIALRFRDKDANWQEISWKEYETKAFQIAKGLMKLGVKKGNSVAIISNNRPEWLFAQMGIMSCGAILSPIYDTNSSEEIAYIVNHSESKYIFVDHQIQYGKVAAALPQMKGLKKIIFFDMVDAPHPKRSISLEDLITLGSSLADKEVEQVILELKPENTSQYLYTSGTTENPKGVIITHQGLDTMGVTTIERFPIEEKVQILSYLPLSHIAEQTVTNIVHLEKGGVVSFCPEIQDLKEYLSEVRPNIFLGVPRVWEKVENTLKINFEIQSPIKKRMLSWARRVEYTSFLMDLKTGESFKSSFRTMANRLVLSKIRKKLGVDRVIFALNGVAPVSPETQRFFASIGVAITDIYGLSESTGILTTTDPARPEPGIIGTPLRGTELKINWDGELLAKGSALTKGYFKDAKNTHQLWREGWMHTGDIAVELKSGAYQITGRKKEIIITAGAKKVAPNKIENYLISIPCIGQAVVIGDKLPYLVALVTLDPDNTTQLAGPLGLSDNSFELMSQDQTFLDYLEQQIKDKVNSRLPRDEAIKNFLVIPYTFSVETGELTPTRKIKRRVVNKKFEEEIMALYQIKKDLIAADNSQ